MRHHGSSLIEVMVASAILIIGLVGIVELLTKGALNNRRGIQPVSAMLNAQESLADYTLFGYSALSAGTFDGGIVYDSSGRRYGRIVTVEADAGVGYPAFLVTVRIESSDPGVTAPVVTTASTIVSMLPDGG